MKTVNILNKTVSGLAAALALLFFLPAAQAAIYNYTITGEVLLGDEFSPNAYNLTAGETITAYGTFTADLGTIGSETGTVLFGSGSDNSMTIDLNGTLLSATDDDGYVSGLYPSLTFLAGGLTDFDFMKTGAPAFSSYFLSFDDFDSMFGDWTSASLTVVPVPAAVWLFGSGLLGLVGLARGRRN